MCLALRTVASGSGRTTNCRKTDTRQDHEAELVQEGQSAKRKRYTESEIVPAVQQAGSGTPTCRILFVSISSSRRASAGNNVAGSGANLARSCTLGRQAHAKPRERAIGRHRHDTSSGGQIALRFSWCAGRGWGDPGVWSFAYGAIRGHSTRRDLSCARAQSSRPCSLADWRSLHTTMFPKGNSLSARLAASLLYRVGARCGVCGALLGVLPFPRTVDGFARRKPFSAPKRPSCSLFLQKLWTTSIRPQLEKPRYFLAFLRVGFRVRKRELGARKHGSKPSLRCAGSRAVSRSVQHAYGACQTARRALSYTASLPQSSADTYMAALPLPSVPFRYSPAVPSGDTIR